MAEKKKPTARGRAVQREAQEAVDQDLMKALGNEVRVAILSLLNFSIAAEWSPKMLAKELGMGLSKVSYHVKALNKFGMIELSKTEPRRGANEHFYRATRRVLLPEGMAAALPKSARSVTLAKVLGMAEKDLKKSLEAGTFDDRPDHHASWSPFQFDDQSRKRVHAKLDEVLEFAVKEEQASLRRATEEGSKLIATTLVMFGFTSARKSGGASSAFRQHA
jgi:DNA-binding transcriptional ArsR family regulator